MKKIIILLVILIIAGAGVWFANWRMAESIPSVSPSPRDTVIPYHYSNGEYGFDIFLPASWVGFSVLNSQWEGRDVVSENNNVIDHGPIITLRHPLWTATAPREDMPIMVFTPAQYALVQQELMSVGAAPIPPSVLGQNSQYVMALPARYNYDYKTGWQEVDQLVHTLMAFEPSATPTPSGMGTLTGHVTVGPICPVEQAGNPCTPSPQAYTSRQVGVFTHPPTCNNCATTRLMIVSQHLDANGNYQFNNLPSGTYDVMASGIVVDNLSVFKGTVTIKSGQTTTLNFSIDTGIR